MAGKLAYERYYWFHGQIKANKYPNARHLAEKFEISHKQAQRDIEFIRDRIGAPLHYNPFKKGYEYEERRYELPPVWYNEDELLALCMALRLATVIPDRSFKLALNNLLKKVTAFRSLGGFSILEKLREKVSIKNIEYLRINEALFHRVVDALFQEKALKISYYSPFTKETSQRLIQPLHLLCYMGSWHLIAFCTLKGEIRDFALSRIKSLEVTGEKIPIPRHLPSVLDYIRRNFGVIVGEESIEVCLKFSSDIADWIEEQVWHKNQILTRNTDGTITLKFPVADFLEVRREILKYGSNVEVLTPLSLRNEIKSEILKMSRIYKINKRRT
ncbi:MAG: WYL domain-containing protein [Candidatus Anstonellales archaeon]